MVGFGEIIGSYSPLGSAVAFVFALVTFGAPLAKDVWRQHTMDAMQEKYGLVALSMRGRVDWSTDGKMPMFSFPFNPLLIVSSVNTTLCLC